MGALRGEGALILDLVEEVAAQRDTVFYRRRVHRPVRALLASEIVREKVFLLTREEIPYGVAVTIDEFTRSRKRT